MSPAAITPELPKNLVGPSLASRFPDLRGLRWRINLGVLPPSLSSTIDDLRRVSADSRRRYATLRRCLLIDPHVGKIGDNAPDSSMDNPLSQNPDSTWGRFFRNAELEKMVDKDLSRLYPEHGSYFQTPGCQGLLRRILLLWCLRHPECGYRQGMHELLAPLLYVLHADIQHFNEVRKQYEDHFVDKFDEDLFNESHDFSFKISSDALEDDDTDFQQRSRKRANLSDLDANIQMIVLLSDPYGAEGELGIVLSDKFLEHDAYCMFDALMNGAGGAVSMAEFYSHLPASPTETGIAPVIEASLALYHLLSIVDSSLYSHLVELGVEPQYFALRWLRVLFGREFSLEDLLIIWDEIFSFDNGKASEHDPGILNSPRGAFISAMAVSMMLNVRSSLLATEYATSCLQRLLNYPENVDLDKLIGKAKSLVTLAIEANAPSHSTVVAGQGNSDKHSGVKGHSHSLSCDLSSPRTPVSLVPERYWEEKWRVIHQEEEAKNESSPKQESSKRKGWTEKMIRRLSRTGSAPSSSKKESRERDRKSSVRRSLLEDLSRQLNFGEDATDENSSRDYHPLMNESDAVLQDNLQESVDDTDKRSSSTASEEHSPLFSDPSSPVGNDSEKSSSGSNTSHDMIDGVTQESCSFESTVEEDPLPISVDPCVIACGVSGTDDSPADACEVSATHDRPRESEMLSKERKSISGKFQWFLKFGRHNSGEDTNDKRPDIEDAKSVHGGNLEENEVGVSADNTNCYAVNMKADGCDQKLIGTLRNLGQSMLENIQVLESAFQQERSPTSSFDQLSKHALVEKGQVTAMTALKELRKISNLLREM